MTNDRIGHYEPLTKNKCFQWIHLKMSKYKKTKTQSWKQITNQVIKETITAMTTSLIKKENRLPALRLPCRQRLTVIGNSVNRWETLAKEKPQRQTSEDQPDL